jgi:hypothetical protein
VGNLSIDRSASIARREYIVRANAQYFSATIQPLNKAIDRDDFIELALN